MITASDLQKLKEYIEGHKSKVDELKEKADLLEDGINKHCMKDLNWNDIKKKEVLYKTMSEISFHINETSQFIGSLEKEKRELKQFVALLNDVNLPSKIIEDLKIRTNSMKDVIFSLQDEYRERREGLKAVFKVYNNFQFIVTSNDLI